MIKRLSPEEVLVSADQHYSIKVGDDTLHYTIVDGQPLFEGDIILQAQSLPAGSTTIRPLLMKAGDKWRWPKGIVPYTIDATFPQAMKDKINAAITHWQADTSIRFALRTATNAAAFPDYVTFRPGTGSSSSLGRVGKQQFINLSPDATTGTAIHEIGHAVGMYHMHSRPDRDSFITVNTDNIEAGEEPQFKKLGFADGNLEITSYDYGSIMHYSGGAFAKAAGLKTIVPLGGQAIGQRNALSDLDIANVADSYPSPSPMLLPASPATALAFGGREIGAVLHYSCYYMDYNGDWQKLPIPDYPNNQGVSRLSISTWGAFLWVCLGHAFQYSSSSHGEVELPSLPDHRGFQDIASNITGSSDYWATSSGGKIFQMSGWTWSEVAGPPNCSAVYIATDTNGVAYITTADAGANVYQYQAGTWTLLGNLHANDVKVGNDHSVWVVGDTGLFTWIGTGWLNVDSAAKTSLAVSSGGLPWTIDAQGNAYGFSVKSYSPWWQMTQSSASDLIVRSSGDLHAIDYVNGLMNWNGSKWIADDGGSDAKGGSVAADLNSPTMFAVSGQSVYVMLGGSTSWTKLGTGTVSLVDVAVTSSNAAFICSAQSLFVVTANPFTVTSVAATVASGISRITVDKKGSLWVVDLNGKVWQLGGGVWIDRGAPNAVDICCLGDATGGVWIATKDGNLASWNGTGWATQFSSPIKALSLTISPQDSGLLWIAGSNGRVYQRLN